MARPISPFNKPLTTGELNSKLFVFSSRYVLSAVFTNRSRELQYLYGPHPTAIAGGNKLDHLVESLYDRSDFLPDLGKVNGSAPSFLYAIIHGNVHTQRKLEWTQKLDRVSHQGMQ